MADVDVYMDGSIALVRPLTDEARQWIEDNVDPETMWFGRRLVVELRCIDNLIDGMRDYGLAVDV